MRNYEPAYLDGGYPELKDEPEVLVRRVANIYDDFKPVLWSIGEVEILRDESGNALGFYYNGKLRGKGWRDDIPAEIFNHQIKDIDNASPEAKSAFMTEYGMIFDSWPGAIDEMAQYCKSVNIRKWGTLSIERLDALISQIDSYITAGPHTSQGRFQTRDLWKAEYERMKWYAENGWDDYEPRLFLVSCEEVQENIDIVFNLVDLAKAAAQSEIEREVAELAGIERCDFFDEILYLDQVLNGLLHVFHPKVGFQYIVDGKAGEPTYYCDLLDIHEGDGPMSASLMNAIALQIRDFNIHLSDAHQCAECGEIFIIKQTTRATSRAHSDSKFCCDKCKNKNTQRRHRESAGYKLKQAKKRAMKKSLENEAPTAH